MAAADAEALAEALDLIGEPGAHQPHGGVRRPHRRTSGRRHHRPRAPAKRTGGRSARGWPACAPNATRSPRSRTTRRPPVTCAPPAGTGARAPRSGGWSGSPTGSMTPRPPPIEGALYGAGLLTAWVHPDPALTEAALAAAEADGYLIPSAPVSGRTLADVLVAEEQDRVAPAVVTAAAWLGRAHRRHHRHPAGLRRSRRSARRPSSATACTLGARPKAAPEYIGATNRASRRRARLAEHDELIEATIAEEERLAGELNRASALLEDFRRARRELPDTRPVAKAAEAVGTHAVLLARARDETAAARTALDAAIAEVDAMTRRLRQAAAERRMPTADDQVDAIARAAAEFENAATQLHAERAKLAQAEEDLAAQTETIERRKLHLRPGRRGTRRAGAAAARPGRGVPHAGGDPAGGRPAGPGADPPDRDAHQRRPNGPTASSTRGPAPSTTRPPPPRRNYAASGSRSPKRSGSSSSRPRSSASTPGPTCARCSRSRPSRRGQNRPAGPTRPVPARTWPPR